MSRPLCSVVGCLEISDYIVRIVNGTEPYEEIELCAYHDNLFIECLLKTDLSKIPDKEEPEKVEFT